MLKYLGMIVGWIFALAVVQTAIAENPTPTPTTVPPPAAVLHYRKIASGPIDIGGSVRFVIDISNTGNLDSTSQTVQDVLPGDIPWKIESTTSWNCTVTSPAPGIRQILDCSGTIVPAQDKNGIPGYVQVTVVGQAVLCGNYVNFANFNGSPIGVPAVAVVNCPATPTPAPTSTPSPTPTAQPTITPAPTSTPVVVTATPTNTPVKVAPAPPNTGNTNPPNYSDHTSYWYITLVAMLFGLGILGMVFTLKGNRNA